jgi:hypothetical protein
VGHEGFDTDRSSTLPDCSENVVWLVNLRGCRVRVFRASDPAKNDTKSLEHLDYVRRPHDDTIVRWIILASG